MAIEKRRLRPGHRTAVAAGLGVLALLAAAFPFREDLVAWFIGYRFIWAPEGAELRGVMNSSGQLLVAGGVNREPDGVWSIGSERIVRLESAPDAEGSLARASGINDQGQVVGTLLSRVGNESDRPFLRTPEGGMRLLPNHPEGQVWFNDLNGADEAVGNFDSGELPTGSTGPSGRSLRATVTRGFFWTLQRGFRGLEPLVQSADPLVSFENASAINEAGWVVGVSTADDRKPHPVIWMPPDHRPSDLGLPPGFDGGSAVAVNDDGEVLVNVWKETSAGGNSRIVKPFVWTAESGYRRIPTPEGHPRVFAEAIDREGTVLLRAEHGAEHERKRNRFLVRRGRILELPLPWGAQDVEYHGLTERGWLIGRARLESRPDSWRSFVARPVR